MTITREQLAAYADGELSGEEKAQVAAAIAADPEMAREIEAHRSLKAKLGEHFAPVMDEPVPDKLAAMLRPETADVVDLATARQRVEAKRKIPRWSLIAGPALAASLAIALFLPGGGDGAAYADTQLAAALENQLVSQQQPQAETRILLSFQNEAGDFCRAFSGSDGGGIACRDDTGWKLEAVGEGSDNPATEYRMAGASDAQLFALAQNMATGPALDAAAEAQAKEAGWR